MSDERIFPVSVKYLYKEDKPVREEDKTRRKLHKLQYQRGTIVRLEGKFILSNKNYLKNLIIKIYLNFELSLLIRHLSYLINSYHMPYCLN